jgi:hypothetical protein
MVSSMAYYIKFDGFSPTFFNQFLVVLLNLQNIEKCTKTEHVVLDVIGT